MGVLKAIVGGLVGGAAGAFVANLIQAFTGESHPAFLLITGLGAGLGIRAAAGVNRSFATGIVGVIATVAVLLGSSVAQSMAEIRPADGEVIVETTDVATDAIEADGESAESLEAAEENSDEQANDGAESSEEEPAESESGDGEPAEEAPTAAEQEAAALAEQADRDAAAAASAATAPDIPIDSSQAKELERRFGWSPMDFLFNAGSALLAFALSTGSGSTRSESGSDDQAS